MSLNFAALLEESARRYPAKAAIISEDQKLSYAELNRLANKVANALQGLGVTPGDKVALMLPNVPYFPICYYGILKLGAVVVPLHFLFKGAEVGRCLRDSDSVALVAGDDFVEEAGEGFAEAGGCRHLIVINPLGRTALPEGALSLDALMAEASPAFNIKQTAPDDPASILYTSGTMGRPKGIEWTHFSFLVHAQALVRDVLKATPDDAFLTAVPLCLGMGNMALTFAVYAGASNTLLPRFEPQKALEAIHRDRVTITTAVPTVYVRLLNYQDADRYDLTSLRLCRSGGAPMPIEVMKAFEEKYEGAIILQTYGLSEGMTVASDVPGRPRKPGSVGLPLPGVELRIVDGEDNEVVQGELGELVVRSPTMMKGYHKRPDATAEVLRHGWLHTGDIGYVDEDGYLFVVSRKDDAILRGGHNIYPREIEEVLYGHPAIAEAAVLGMPDPDLGKEVKAFVTLKDGYQISEEDIIAFCRERLAAYKYPRHIEILSTMPKSPSGKILKKRLRNSTHGGAKPQEIT
jgi:long-chain acyl-CoA synthetase